MHLKTLAFILLVVIAASPLQAQSQTPEGTAAASRESHEHHHWRHHQAWFWKKLNLTETQRTYIKQLRQNNKTTIQPALLLVLKDRQALQQATTGNDAGSIASAATKLGT